jgi:hypothetical protein
MYAFPGGGHFYLEFYDLAEPPNNENESQQMDHRLKYIENAAAGDKNLEFLIEGLKEGKQRSDIAELLGINVRQLDRLREKLMRQVQKTQSSQNRHGNVKRKASFEQSLRANDGNKLSSFR